MCKDCKYYLKNVIEQEFICALEWENKDRCDSCDEFEEE